jgi:hypothetical protein
MAEQKKAAPRAGAAAIALMIAGVIAVEGGYVNHPADPGGETNMGITKAVAVQNGYAGPMRTLPREVAESIYYRQYIVAPGYEPLVAIDAPVTEELFDTTVNMGARGLRAGSSSRSGRCAERLSRLTARSAPGPLRPIPLARLESARAGCARQCSTASMRSSGPNTSAWSGSTLSCASSFGLDPQPHRQCRPRQVLARALTP